LVEHVATHAARHADRLLAGPLARARRNREVLRAWVEQHHPLVEWTPPAGGVTAFPYLPGVGDDRVFADRLERERGTLVVPGSCFGRPGRLRLGFGGPTEELTVGLDRLAAALREPAEQQGTRRGDRDAQLHAGA
jgi:aspartate/methionine/tyrosine aminotransferase